MIFISVKGINRVISKRMSSIYLKVTIEKNSTFKFLLNLLQLKNQSSGSKTNGL